MKNSDVNFGTKKGTSLIASRKVKVASNSIKGGDNASSVELDVPFPQDYSDLLEQVSQSSTSLHFHYFYFILFFWLCLFKTNIIVFQVS